MSAELLALCLTDVEGSTRHWRQSAAGMSEALFALDDAVERAVSPHGGEVVKSRGEGDSHFIVFRTATGAVRAAADLQVCLSATRWPGETGLAVRIALHAGEVESRDGDYAGIAIAHTARLRGTAHGGQIVASRVVADLARDRLDADVWLAPLGRHRILDMPGWTEVFQVCGHGMAHDFPPLNTLDTGLPPLSTIVFVDAVGFGNARESSLEDQELRRGRLLKLLVNDFNAAGGQYLKLLGDGCLALFADPDAAVAFARAALADTEVFGLELRIAAHVGRIEFAEGEPIGPPLHLAAKLLSRAPAGRIACSPVARAVLGEGDDLVAIT